MNLPGSSDGKESTYSVGALGLIPGLGRSPGGGHGSPLQYSCLWNPHGQRSYSPWGHKELDTTERLSALQTKFMHILGWHPNRQLKFEASSEAFCKMILY